jgi:hypothetical protein
VRVYVVDIKHTSLVATGSDYAERLRNHRFGVLSAQVWKSDRNVKTFAKPLPAPEPTRKWYTDSVQRSRPPDISLYPPLPTFFWILLGGAIAAVVVALVGWLS